MGWDVIILGRGEMGGDGWNEGWDGMAWGRIGYDGVGLGGI